MSIKPFFSALLLIFFISFPLFAFAQFKDIEKDSLQYMVEHHIIQGYEDGTFRPKNSINRAEFLKIVLETAGINLTIPTKNCFSDVPSNEWFATYVCTAKENSWIQGYPDGLFRPNQTINKAEALKITANITNWELPTTTEIQNETLYEMYSDTPRNEWYSPYVAAALNIGYFDAASKLEPWNYISREDIAELLFRVLLTQKLYDSGFRHVDIKNDLSLEADNFFQIENRLKTLTLDDFKQTDEETYSELLTLEKNGWQYGMRLFASSDPFLDKEGENSNGQPLKGGEYDPDRRFHLDTILLVASFAPGETKMYRYEWFFLGIPGGYTFSSGTEEYWSIATTDDNHVKITRKVCSLECEENPYADEEAIDAQPDTYEYHLTKDKLQPVFRGASNRLQSITFSNMNETAIIKTLDPKVQDLIDQYHELQAQLSEKAKNGDLTELSNEEEKIIEQMTIISQEISSYDTNNINAALNVMSYGYDVSITINGKKTKIQGNSSSGARFFNTDSIMSLIATQDVKEHNFILNRGENTISITYKKEDPSMSELTVELLGYDNEKILIIEAKTKNEGIIEKVFTLESTKPTDFQTITVSE